MIDSDKIKAEEHAAPEAAPAKRCATAAWIAVALAVAAWFTLMYSSGYAAIAVGIAGLGISIWSCIVNTGALRRLSIAAIIASAVLTLVTAAFILFIKAL